MIYNSLVKPHLLYLIEIWGVASKSNIAQLQIAQNKIIKLLFHYPYLTPSDKVYKETKLMNIKQLYNYTTCILIRKILDKKIHTEISFESKGQLHKYATRRASHLPILPKTRTKSGKKMIVFEGAKLYNNLPKQVKTLKNFTMFKSRLYNHILYNDSLLK